jgi:nicotinamidase-related amidase
MTETLAPIDPRSTALLVMDYQPGILDLLDDAQSDELLARAKQAIELARARDMQVGYVRVAFADADYQDVPATSRMGARIASSGRALHADSPATAVHPDIAPQPQDIVVRKTRVGAFSTTDLDSQLRARGIDTLILAGISTSGVILSTVRDAHDRDYRLLVLADACADPQPGVHEFLIEQILPRQADAIELGDLDDLVVAAKA